MRSTDDLNPERFQPLGSPIPRPAPSPAPAPKPQGPSGIVADKKGRMSTTTHPEPSTWPAGCIVGWWGCA